MKKVRWTQLPQIHIPPVWPTIRAELIPAKAAVRAVEVNFMVMVLWDELECCSDPDEWSRLGT